MSSEITLNQIYRSKTYELSEVMNQFEHYSAETFILAFSEIKRRGITVNDEMKKPVERFSKTHGNSIEEIEMEYFQHHGFLNYKEYYDAMLSVSNERSEDVKNWDQQKKALKFEQRIVEKKEAKRDLLIGGFWLAGGLTITIITLANEGSGFVAYGAIIVGAVQFFKGLVKS